MCKYSGLSLSNQLNEYAINEKTFEKFLVDFINHTESSIPLQQKINQSDFRNLRTSSQFQKYSFQNKICTRRIIDYQDVCMTTFPYGYFRK